MARGSRPARGGCVVLLLAGLVPWMSGCDADNPVARLRREQLEIGRATYVAAPAATCEGVAGTGAAGRTDGLRTPGGAGFNVRAPANYDARRAHPLLVVYAPAGTDAPTSERVAALTRTATSAGYVVAYAAHLPLGPRGAAELGRIPDAVAARWCIDRGRVFLSGHSDGGSVTHIVALASASRAGIAGIAPSAAGVQAADLQAYGCRAPISVMVMHSREDDIFPGFGTQAARWWARCNGCSDGVAAAHLPGCVAYRGCAAPVLYCEASGPHWKWPARGEDMMTFFSAGAGP
jgi:polyhydroxybutyrate depolymerase